MPRNALEYPEIPHFESLHDCFILEFDGIDALSYVARGAYTIQFQCSCRCFQASRAIGIHLWSTTACFSDHMKILSTLVSVLSAHFFDYHLHHENHKLS